MSNEQENIDVYNIENPEEEKLVFWVTLEQLEKLKQDPGWLPITDHAGLLYRPENGSFQSFMLKGSYDWGKLMKWMKEMWDERFTDKKRWSEQFRNAMITQEKRLRDFI